MRHECLAKVIENSCTDAINSFKIADMTSCLQLVCSVVNLIKPLISISQSVMQHPTCNNCPEYVYNFAVFVVQITADRG